MRIIYNTLIKYYWKIQGKVQGKTNVIYFQYNEKILLENSNKYCKTLRKMAMVTAKTNPKLI